MMSGNHHSRTSESRQRRPPNSHNFNTPHPRPLSASSSVSSRSDEVKSHPKTARSLRQIPKPDDPVLCFCGEPASKAYTEAFGEQYDCHNAHPESQSDSTSQPSTLQISRSPSPPSDFVESSKTAWSNFAERKGKVQSSSPVVDSADNDSVHHVGGAQTNDQGFSTAKPDPRPAKPPPPTSICAFHVHTKVWRELLESYDRSVKSRDSEKAELTELLLNNPELSCAWFNFAVCVTFDVFNSKRKIPPPVPSCFCNRRVIMKEVEKKKDESGLRFGRIYFTCSNYDIDGARPKCTWILSAKDVPFVRSDIKHDSTPHVHYEEEDMRKYKEDSPTQAVAAEVEMKMNSETSEGAWDDKKHYKDGGNHGEGEWGKTEETFEDDWINKKKPRPAEVRELPVVLNLGNKEEMRLPIDSLSDDEVYSRTLKALEALAKPRNHNKQPPREETVGDSVGQESLLTLINGSSREQPLLERPSSQSSEIFPYGERSSSQSSEISGERPLSQSSEISPSSQSSEILSSREQQSSQSSEILPPRTSSPYSTFSDDQYPQYGPTTPLSFVFPLHITENKTQPSEICPNSPCTTDNYDLTIDSISTQQVDDQTNPQIKDLIDALEDMKREYEVATEEQEKEMQELRERLDEITANSQKVEFQQSTDFAKLKQEIEIERKQRHACQEIAHVLEANIIELESERDGLKKNIVESKEKEKIRDLKCRVCFEKSISTAIVPCFHVVLCEDCADRIHECAVCRQKKVSTQRIYIG